MKTMRPHTSVLQAKLLRFIIVLWCIGALPQTDAAASAISEQTIPTVASLPAQPGPVQVASLYPPTTAVVFPERASHHDASTPVIPVAQRIQIAAIGAILLIIGTFFMPHMLPQFAGYHEKFARFLEHTANTYKRIFTIPQVRMTAQSGGSVRMTAAVQPPLGRKGPPDMKVPYPATRGGQRVAATNRIAPRKMTPQSVIETFFQQSGFAVTEAAATEWRITSQLTRYKCYGEIPVYLMPNAGLNAHHIQNIYAKMLTQPRATNSPGNPRLGFVIVNKPVEQMAYEQIYTYRVNHHVIIIPLSQPFVAKSVRYAACAQQLEEKISAFTGQTNLYAMTTPVADPLAFFGRPAIVSQIQSALNKQACIGLFGLPKIGKTWLLWLLKEQLSQQLTIYIDLHQFPKSASYLYRKIIDEGVREISFKAPMVTLPKLKLSWTGSGQNDAPEFCHDLLTLWNVAKIGQPGVQKMVLLLDGAEQLLQPSTESSAKEKTPGFQEFFATLKSLAQQYGFLTTLLSCVSPQGVRKHCATTLPCDQRFFLPSLVEEHCNQMISGLGVQMGLMYSEEALSRVYYETGGHPYVTRQLCSLIAKNLRRSKMIPLDEQAVPQSVVSVREVEQAVAEYLEYKSEYLHTLWQQFSPIEQEMLRKLANDASRARDELIPPTLVTSAKEKYQRALKVLQENDLLEYCEEKYTLKMGLLAQLSSTIK
jgi:hypothetical protein